MTELAKLSDHNEIDLPDQAVTDPSGNCNGRVPLERLRQAVTAAGGTGKVSDRSGVPIRTLSHYLAGRDMKASAMIAIAEACGVSLDWLATGKGPVHPAAPAPPEPSLNPTPEPTRGLFSTVSIDRLAAALDAVETAFRTHHLEPQTRHRLRLALLMYDALDSDVSDLNALLRDFPATSHDKENT